MTTHLIESLLQTKDFKRFEDFVKSLDNINKSLIKSEVNSLNLMHIYIGSEESDYSLKCLKHLLSEPDIDINCLAKVENLGSITGAHYAVIWGHNKCLQLLIDSGIDLFICDSNGKTVSEYAVEAKLQSAIDLIVSAVNRYFNCQTISFSVNKTSHKLDSNENIINCGQNMTEKTESNETVMYFNENDNIWEGIRNKSSNSCDSSDSSDNCSENTIISNISYEKTNSIKSCCSERSEVYLYNDRDNNVVLIEERYEGCVGSGDNIQSLEALNQLDVISKGCVTQTPNKSDDQIHEILNLNESVIFRELRAKGDSPGPVIKTTKRFYAKRLLNMRKGLLSPSKKVLPLPQHSEELNRLLENTFPFDEALKLEQQFNEFYEKDGSKRHFFNYILLDPILTQNIPFEAINAKIAINCCNGFDTKLLLRFIQSVFYVGKGQGNRVYEHFYEAIKTTDPKNCNKKVERIQTIWSKDKGVVSLHCFPNITSNEALAREAMIIDALVLSNLTNHIKGQNVKHLQWNDRKKRIFGSYLLYKAFLIYLLTGERQIRRPIVQ